MCIHNMGTSPEEAGDNRHPGAKVEGSCVMPSRGTGNQSPQTAPSRWSLSKLKTGKVFLHLEYQLQTKGGEIWPCLRKVLHPRTMHRSTFHLRLSISMAGSHSQGILGVPEKKWAGILWRSSQDKARQMSSVFAQYGYRIQTGIYVFQQIGLETQCIS